MDINSETRYEKGEVLLFNKPLYWTSFDLVKKVRSILQRTLGIRKLKVGHAGTLDPLATGLMIICTGRATREITKYQNLDKEYIVTLQLGKTTPSFDLETEIDNQYPISHITESIVRETLCQFIGEQQQVPPLYSAKMIKGKRAYEYARRGISREISPVTVHFREIELLDFNMPEIRIRLKCSKGTYIRSFARDLGNALNSGCYLSLLERTSIGPYKNSDAFTIEKFTEFISNIKM